MAAGTRDKSYESGTNEIGAQEVCHHGGTASLGKPLALPGETLDNPYHGWIDCELLWTSVRDLKE